MCGSEYLNMADNGLVHDDLEPKQTDTGSDNLNQSGERRAFLRKAAFIGVPVLIATVQPRTAEAWTKSCAGSARPSKKC